MGTVEGGKKGQKGLRAKFATEEEYRAYMSSLARKVGSDPEATAKATATKLEQDPNHFKKLGSKGGRSPRKSV